MTEHGRKISAKWMFGVGVVMLTGFISWILNFWQYSWGGGSLYGVGFLLGVRLGSPFLGSLFFFCGYKMLKSMLDPLVKALFCRLVGASLCWVAVQLLFFDCWIRLGGEKWVIGTLIYFAGGYYLMSGVGELKRNCALSRMTCYYLWMYQAGMMILFLDVLIDMVFIGISGREYGLLYPSLGLFVKIVSWFIAMKGLFRIIDSDLVSVLRAEEFSGNAAGDGLFSRPAIGFVGGSLFAVAVSYFFAIF